MKTLFSCDQFSSSENGAWCFDGEGNSSIILKSSEKNMFFLKENVHKQKPPNTAIVLLSEFSKYHINSYF